VKSTHKIAVAMLVGIGLGSLGTRAATAQAPPSALYIAEVSDVTNADDMAKYAAAAPATVEKYGGRYVVRGGKTVTLEGQPPARIVITAFKSMADAQKWYDSPEYSALRPLRQRSAKSRSFIVERFED
jgi:uncharacterized protein (DUF1330 family)